MMNAKVPVPAPRPGLRLLCLLCQKTGAYQPVATLRPVPPRSVFSGRWSNAADTWPLAPRQLYIPLGLGLYLSPALAHTAPAEVLARGARHRQTNPVRPSLGSIRTGV